MKSCKRGVLCSFYILGADKQDYEYRTSLTHIFHQIALSVLNLNQPLPQMFTTHHQRIRIFSFFSYANLLADKKYTASRNVFAKIRKCCWRSGISPKNWLSIDIWRSRNVLNTKERAKQQFGILENVKRRKGLVGGSYLKSGTGNGKAVIRVKCSFLGRFHFPLLASLLLKLTFKYLFT